MHHDRRHCDRVGTAGYVLTKKHRRPTTRATGKYQLGSHVRRYGNCFSKLPKPVSNFFIISGKQNDHILTGLPICLGYNAFASRQWITHTSGAAAVNNSQHPLKCYPEDHLKCTKSCLGRDRCRAYAYKRCIIGYFFKRSVTGMTEMTKKMESRP